MMQCFTESESVLLYNMYEALDMEGQSMDEEN